MHCGTLNASLNVLSPLVIRCLPSLGIGNGNVNNGDKNGNGNGNHNRGNFNGDGNGSSNKGDRNGNNNGKKTVATNIFTR